MEQTDTLTLSIIFLDGYDAAHAGEPRATNPCEGSLTTIWLAGWDEGKSVRYSIGAAFLRAYQNLGMQRE